MTRDVAVHENAFQRSLTHSTAADKVADRLRICYKSLLKKAGPFGEALIIIQSVLRNLHSCCVCKVCCWRFGAMEEIHSHCVEVDIFFYLGSFHFILFTLILLLGS